MLAPAKADAPKDAVDNLAPEDKTALLKEGSAPDGFAKTMKPKVEVPVEPSKAVVIEPSKAVPAAPVDAAKPDAPKPEAPKAEPDFFERLERELAKPEGQEDLKDFNSRERAYFHQMRRDRVARRSAEADRDAALFRESQLKKQAPAEPVDPLSDLKKKDPSDYLTVKEAMELLQKSTPKPEAPAPAPASSPDPVRLKYLVLCEKEARSAHDDFDSVMELSDELVSTDTVRLKQVAEAVGRGENPAEVMYGLIKAHPDFATLYPAAEVRWQAKQPKADAPKADAPVVEPSPVAEAPVDAAKKAEAEKAQAALEANAAKTKTTGHVSTSDTKPADELELEDIAKMTDRQFARLPKAVRQRYLQKFG